MNGLTYLRKEANYVTYHPLQSLCFLQGVTHTCSFENVSHFHVEYAFYCLLMNVLSVPKSELETTTRITMRISIEMIATFKKELLQYQWTPSHHIHTFLFWVREKRTPLLR